MKLASLKEGRDGCLIVVSRDLQHAVRADSIASTLQKALDNWDELAPQLQTLYDDLNTGRAQNSFKLDVGQLAAPLPRAYQWADASAYLSHVELTRKARGAEMPSDFLIDPLMYQGGSDGFLGPTDSIPFVDESWGLDFEAEIAVVTGDVPMGTKVSEAGQCIRLITLTNDISLRLLIPKELAKGFGFFQGKPANSFAPVMVTPNELGSAWQDAKVHLPLKVTLNGKLFGSPNAGVDMYFNFAQLIAHAAKTRSLCAGSIIGSGTVSNHDRSVGSACLVEVRMLETLNKKEDKTPFLKPGDHVRIEMFGPKGQSIFGAIDQRVVPLQREVKVA